MKIVIFDSGVGGLSIFHEVYKRLPEAEYIYVFDNEAYPYGELDDAILISRTTTIVSTLVEQYSANIVVIACNTASTIVLPVLRSMLTIPVVGVVPAIKPAAQQSVKRKVGLLATPATIGRPYIDALIKDYAMDCDVIRYGSTTLVQMAEDKLRGRAIDKAVLKDILAPFAGVDQLVLGCTHFPLLKEEIVRVLGDSVTTADSGKAIALRVETLLKGRKKPISKKRGLAFCTRLDASAKELEAYFNLNGFAGLQPLNAAILLDA
ncbi:glutamate racemase [Thaumasiovibrio sp. DFM-14]|uniref:glutamate racemase n=1 Tax=Thaumasiovibrio sp. DFM-14 TaxID=3384792 RepID=UPI0039A2FC91